MKKLLFTSLLILITSFALGQTVVKGSVKGSDGTPIPGANVYIKGTTSGGVTDFDGNYSFTTNLTGDQILQASYIGYGSQEKSVAISGAEVTVDFILNEDAQQLDEVVLTGTNTVRTQKETPLSLTSFKAKDLQTKLNTSSQADILRNVPGITAEGGGGEVASNVFVRGLPSGGQFQFNPLQIDGVPVLSTFGLNSSAHDVYFRNDLGFQSLEFVRGGSSILYGVGSVAGIINYTSATGGPVQKTVLQLETASNGRYKADFLTSGPLGGEDSNMYYALSGFYRYDEGPLITGLPTEGFQIRGNIKKINEKGSITISGQYIDDQVQFFLPFPLDGGSRERPIGNNGREIFTLQTAAAADLTYQNPNGTYRSPIEDGVSTVGGYVLADFKHNFSESFKLNAKLRYSNYKHQFNLFLDGSGVSGAAPVETQAEYAALRLPAGTTDFTFTFDDNGQAVDANDRLFENRILDRDRPLRELVGDIKFTKEIGAHSITFGSFLSRSEAGDFNIITSYLGEFNNRPRLINLTYTDPGSGETINYTVNGISNRGAGYTNRNISSNKIAFFAADEIKLERWNIDFGFRIERANGIIENESTADFVVDESPNIGTNLSQVRFGNGDFTRGEVTDIDAAFVVAGLYKVTDDLSVYGNFSRGYFFPELRSVRFNANGEPSTYEAEEIIQGEAGVKYGKSSFSGTFAAYYVGLNDRRSINFINDPNGPGLIEEVEEISTRTFGIEATWNWRIIESFILDGTFTLQDHEVTESTSNPELEGNEQVRQPNVLARLGLNYNHSNFDANATWNYTGEKFANSANTIELDAINIINLNAGYTFKIGDNNETMRLGATVFNLFNSDGITEGSPRLGNNQTEAEFFVGRPILPTRLFLKATFSF